MMQNLTKLGSQMVEIWKQLAWNQRLTVLSAAVVVLVALLSLGFWSSRVDYALLYGRLDDAEAARVVAVLEESKVPYKTGSSGGAIYVPSDKVHTMRMQLASRGLPRGDGVGFEIFDKPNFGLSDFVQRANYLRAVQGELARTIGQLDEVETARVMIVMPENRLLIDNQKRPTASVFIRVKRQFQLGAEAVNSIRFLVANAVEGLQPSNVSVVDNRGNVLSDNSEPDSLAGLSSGQLAARRQIEQYLSKKVEDMLQTVLGPGQAVVRVAAEISTDTLNRVEEKFDPDGQVLRTSTIDDENSDTSTGSGGGVAGIVPNTAADTNSLAAAGSQNSTRTKKKTTTIQNEVSRTTSSLLKSAGSIERLSAAVFIAAKVEGAGADRKIVPRTEDELKRLRNIVQSALGLQLGPDAMRQDEISLEEMPFNDQANLVITQQLEREQRREFWLNLAKSLVYPALALGILVFFWRAFQRTPAENIPPSVLLGPFSDLGNGHGSRPGGDWSKISEPGVVTVDVLNRLVRENPENMSQAIRTWLSRGKPVSK